jgi:hypothetical protein
MTEANTEYEKPLRFEQDKALGIWVCMQRCFHTKNKIAPDRKELLDELEFVWRTYPPDAARSSTVLRQALEYLI